MGEGAGDEVDMSSSSAADGWGRWWPPREDNWGEWRRGGALEEEEGFVAVAEAAPSLLGRVE